MVGNCVFAQCAVANDDELAAEPFVIYNKLVHHICSNANFDGALSVRECSTISTAYDAGLTVAQHYSLIASEIASANEPSASGQGVARVKKRQTRGGRASAPDGQRHSDDDANDHVDGHGGDHNSVTTVCSELKHRIFSFTTPADLALLKQAAHMRPFVVSHGQMGQCYEQLASNLSERLKCTISARTAKGRLKNLVNEFEKEDKAYRRKTNVAEQYNDHKQLLIDIVLQLANVQEAKSSKKDVQERKADKFLSDV